MFRQADFETSERSGAILVLPAGASREELVGPSKIYPYVKKHAISWYQYYNGDSDGESTVRIPNGTISEVCLVNVI